MFPRCHPERSKGPRPLDILSMKSRGLRANLSCGRVARNTGILPVSSNGHLAWSRTSRLGSLHYPSGSPRRIRPRRTGSLRHFGCGFAAVGGLSSTKRVDPRDIAADNQRVNVVCALVSGDALKVHEVADHRVTIRDSRGAEYVARLA